MNIVGMAALITLLTVQTTGSSASPSFSNADLDAAALERARVARAQTAQDDAAFAAMEAARKAVLDAYWEKRRTLSMKRAAITALAVARKQPYVRSARFADGRLHLQYSFSGSSEINLRRLEEKDPF